MEFDDDKCQIKDKSDQNKLVIEGIQEVGLYRFIASTTRPYSTENNSMSRLWHHRFGHMGFQYLALLKKFNMVSGLLHIKEVKRVYEACLMGK